MIDAVGAIDTVDEIGAVDMIDEMQLMGFGWKEKVSNGHLAMPRHMTSS